jgi:hypothetical protein
MAGKGKLLINASSIKKPACKVDFGLSEPFEEAKGAIEMSAQELEQRV